jgi:beta-lactamase regulating signal transducer with metallopeptidase domain
MNRIVELAVNFLLNAAWQIAAVALAASLGARLLRDAPARLRHAVWVAALVLSVALPLASVFNANPTLEAARSTNHDGASERSTIAATASRAPTLATVAGEQATTDHAATETTMAGGFDFVHLLRRRTQTVASVPALASALVVCYALFLLCRFFALALAWRRARQLRRSSRVGELPASLNAVAERCRAAFGLRRVALACSAEVSTPATIGAFMPLVVLPENFCDGVSVEALTSVVGHELAHVARRDFALNLAYELLLLPASFHPLARLFKRQIDRTRELACDELVAGRLLAPDAYARSLVSVAREIALPAARALTLGVFDADILEERIMRLTQRTRRHDARAARLLALASFSFLCLSCLAISTFSLEMCAVASSSSVADATASKSATGEAREGVAAQSQQTESPAQERSSPPPPRETGTQALNSDNAQARAQAACEAGHKRAVNLIPALVSMLGDDAPTQSQRCWEDDRWSPALDSFKQPSPGEQAAIALASMGTPALAPLTKALDDSNASVRRNAAWAIGELTNMRETERADAVPTLVSLLSDSDEWVRAAAARALGEIRDERAADKLIALLSDGESHVRAMAAWALSEMKEERAVETLCRVVVSDPQADVRRAAAEALGEIRSQKALASLRQALNDAEPRVRAKAKWAISEIEDSDG